MTANQVAYWQLQESKRHNTVLEETEKGKLSAQSARWQDQSRIESEKNTIDRGNLAVNQQKADVAAQEAYNRKVANEINVANVLVNGLKAASMFI